MNTQKKYKFQSYNPFVEIFKILNIKIIIYLIYTFI